MRLSGAHCNRYVIILSHSFHYDSDSYVLKCSDNMQPKACLHVEVDYGCDVCFEEGRVKFGVLLSCYLTHSSCQPSNCIIRNPDGITAQKLVDYSNISTEENSVSIYPHLLNNPVDFPVSPTLQGVWTCTCTHEEGISTDSTILARCCELLVVLAMNEYDIYSSLHSAHHPFICVHSDTWNVDNYM